MADRLMRLSAALLIAAPVAASIGAQGVQYAPGTTRYRVITTTKGTQTAFNNSTDFEVGLREQITVDVMKHAQDTVMATMTLDSIALKSNGPVPDPAALTGAKWVSLYSPNGKFYSAKSPERTIDPQLASIVDGVARFLPSYRGSLALGTTWADTVSGKVNQSGMEVNRTSISNFKVTGDTTIVGEKAMRIERVTNVKAGGNGTLQGTAVIMDTQGNSKGEFYVSPKGQYLGGRSNDDVNVKITILAQGADIMIKQAVENRIEAIH